MCLVSKESESVLDLTDRTELSSGKNRKEKQEIKKRKERHLGGYSVGDPPLSIPNRLGIHLYPYRTEKLSPMAPMVLRKSGRVGSRRFLKVRRVMRECIAITILRYILFLF